MPSPDRARALRRPIDVLLRRLSGVSGAVRKRAWISGRVQNVWFRDSCAREAARYGVTGWVSNLPDGRVEAVFEGEAAAVDALIAWCHDGPPRAQVTSVEVRDELVIGERGFAIR